MASAGIRLIEKQFSMDGCSDHSADGTVLWFAKVIRECREMTELVDAGWKSA